MRPGGSDLHTHTTFSDGLLPPDALVRQAVEMRFECVAITDHDCCDGCAPARAAAGDAVEVVSGVEISAPGQDDDSPETHLVGLFVDPAHPELTAALREARRARRERILKMLERLNHAGIVLRPSEVFDPSCETSVSRLHVAQALVRAGVVGTVAGAFRKWIGPGGSAYVPRAHPGAAETIRLLHRAGGVAVLAHPDLATDEARLDALRRDGLDGMETWFPDQSWRDRQRWESMATNAGLLASGGSDSHGEVQSSAALGCVRLDRERVEALRARAKSIREDAAYA